MGLLWRFGRLNVEEKGREEGILRSSSGGATMSKRRFPHDGKLSPGGGGRGRKLRWESTLDYGKKGKR